VREPHPLSYSSLSTLEKNPEQYYVEHLAGTRPPKEAQSPPMAVGSAFDAYVKAELHAALFGRGADERYEFGAIFESQVEEHNWDFALRAGKHVFKAYRLCGAFSDLLEHLKLSTTPPRFEFRLDAEIGGVPFVGKPDCQFVPDFGEGAIEVVYDWKVRGYCSKYGASPSKGYAVCLDGFEAPKHTRSHGKEHGLYLARQFKGMTINAGFMETCSTAYADQLCLYGWLLGETPGDENIVLGIEEIVSKFMGEGKPPQLRYARHRALCKKDYQLKLLERIQTAWARITSGHFFPEMSLEESQARCALLEDMSVGLAAGSGDETGDWFNDVTRDPYRG